MAKTGWNQLIGKIPARKLPKYLQESGDAGDIEPHINDSSIHLNSEDVMDVVASLLTEGSNISLNYDDGSNTLTISSTDPGLNQEEVEDIVGALITEGNGITVNYDDANDNLTISIDFSEFSLGDISNVDFGTLEDKQILEYDGSNFVNVISPDFKKVQNDTGSTIVAGTLVEIIGDSGTVPSIQIADKDTSERVSGILIEDIAGSGIGLMQLQGTVLESFINTDTMTPGNQLYLGDNGSYTETRPSSGNVILIGTVGAAAPSNGSILLDMPAFVLSHSDLKDLNADDHTQYHTDARALTWLETQQATPAQLLAKSHMF